MDNSFIYAGLVGGIISLIVTIRMWKAVSERNAREENERKAKTKTVFEGFWEKVRYDRAMEKAETLAPKCCFGKRFVDLHPLVKQYLLDICLTQEGNIEPESVKKLMLERLRKDYPDLYKLMPEEFYDGITPANQEPTSETSYT